MFLTLTDTIQNIIDYSANKHIDKKIIFSLYNLFGPATESSIITTLSLLHVLLQQKKEKSLRLYLGVNLWLYQWNAVVIIQ